MPAKYSVKSYVEDGVYHIFNRGVEKRDIFEDWRDYKMFLHLLKSYLSQPRELTPDQGSTLRRKNFVERIELLAYCLMPNHFHLLIRQKNGNDISEFIRSLATNYVMYFNKRHDRIGSLFQGIFKAILVENDEYLVHLSRYIHVNSKEINLDPLNYSYSSYLDYLGRRSTKWVKPDLILDLFKSNKTAPEKYQNYKSFVEDYKTDSKEILGELSLEG